MRALFFLILLTACTHLHAQQTFCTDSLVQDFRYFVEQLEQTHPAPYTRFGGKASFHKAVETCEMQMRSDSISTSKQLAACINNFLAPLHDGHTSIANPSANPLQNNEMFCAPIKFKVLEDGLMVRAIDNSYNHLIGSRLLEVEGVKVGELYLRAAANYSSENTAGTYLNASWVVRNKGSLARCIGQELTDSLHITLLDAEGTKHSITLPFLTQDALRAMHYESADSRLLLPTKNMGYALLDEEGQTMYFRASAMYARDNIEYEYKNGMSTFADDLNYCYSRVHADKPDSTEEAIAQLPSFSGEFYEMLLEMKRHGSQNLIIDLRGNTGGWTPIALPTLYQMWGNDYLAKNMSTTRSILISHLYIEKLNTTLDDFNAANGTNCQYGDCVTIGGQNTSFSEGNAEQIIMSDRMMSCVKDKLLQQEGCPVYTPENVYVVTDVQTFSAAFHYAFYLWKMGAKIVGTSSSQAPNTFMEQTPLYLPITHLFASISNSVQMFLPADDPKAEMLVPDYPMTEDLYRKYAYDNNADILYILDELTKK